jgi:5-deoxy-glucuronate isomerase
VTEWFHPHGTLAADDWEIRVDDRIDGWRYTGLRVGDLTQNTLHLEPTAHERIVLPLSGHVTIEWRTGDASGTERLRERADVFDGPPDAAYLPPRTAAVLVGSGRVAIAEAAADGFGSVAVLRAEDGPVELRGAGASSRQVHNFGSSDGLHALKLIVVEVITPAGNWSSFPAHKHDEERAGVESELEEIYYFEAAVTRSESTGLPTDPFGMFATYGSPGREISTTALVRTGDVALVPFGYHGPTAAAPGYDLYYLNVMAGPGSNRSWLITDDPAHAWVRSTWQRQDVDPRLPYGRRRTQR